MLAFCGSAPHKFKLRHYPGRSHLDSRGNLTKSLAAMNRDHPLKHFVLAFLIALALYLAAFNGIEHLRYRKGPWQATFTTESNGVPVIVAAQPILNITNLRITFPDNTTTNRSQTINFRQPRPTPYDVPF